MNRNFVTLTLSSLYLLGLCTSAQAATAPPDLTGIWQRVGYTAATTAERGQTPPLLPEAAKVYAEHKAAAAKGDKTQDLATVCLPEGIPRLMLKAEPFEILQRPTLLAFVYQVNRLPRVVYLNEQPTTDDSGYYLGTSVGKWQDDELVIETRNFNDLTLLDDAGLPHSDQLRVLERLSVIDGGKRLRNRITIEDPATFRTPWTTTVTYQRLPGYQMPEDVCAERIGGSTPRPRPAKR